MEISKIPGGPVVAANTSTRSSAYARWVGSFHTGRNVDVSGQINQSDPVQSSVNVAFTVGECEDSGTYSCIVSYTEPGASDVRSAVAQRTIPDPCGVSRFN
ncbi:hypothetical protein BaRGS_00017692 [Batillaria attramentaria]|uniref:Ig-like domain-containing protein n=1 Tax=Batillaria attramentaria TaxID=370345 RepID=A0ABD0KV83_9CAEN